MFDVVFTPQGSNAQNCTAETTHTYEVGSSSNVARSTFPPLLLIHDPDTTAPGETCAYQVRFPQPFTAFLESGESHVLANTGADTTTITGPTEVERFYEAQPPGTLFRPDISVRVPFLDPSSDGDNRLSGATISVTYTPIDMPEQDERCTPMVTETFAVATHGTFSARGRANPSPVRRQLVDTPEGAAGPCRYNANFDDSFSHTYDGNNVGPYAILSGDNQEVTAGGSVEVIYSNVSLISPDLTLTVPPTTDSGTGNNIYSGGRLRLDVEATGGPSSGCTEDPSGSRFTHHFQVQDNGDVEPETDTPLWVDSPGATGTLSCEYTVTFPAEMTSPAGVTPPWTLYRHGSATQTVTAGQLALGRSYMTTEPSPGTTFTPTVTLTVPQYDRDGAVGTNWYAGTSFEVTFTAKTGAGLPTSGCSQGAMPGSPVRKSYVVGTTGTVAPDGGAPVLADVPASDPASCVYEVAIPAMASSEPSVTPAWTLRIDDTTTAEVSNTDAAGGSTTVERRFDADAINFVPAVALTVPPIIGLTSEQNLFNRQTFDVTIARAPNSHDECSLPMQETVRFTVDAAGTATGAPPATLVDRPMGQVTRCAYAVTFPPMATSASGAELTWRLTPRSTSATLGGGPQASVTGAYDTPVAVTYAPDVTIAVPPYTGDDDPATLLDESSQNAFTGAQLVAGFANAASECVDANFTFTVRPGGTVVADDSSTTLVAYPAGATAVCSYDVTFSPNEVNGTRLVLRGGATPTVTGVAQAASASYHAATTTFVPDITVAAPFVDADDDEVNDLNGVTIEVRYVPVAGSDSGCLTGLADTYEIASGGSASTGAVVMPPAAPASLVDRPTGVNERCSYTADAPAAITPTSGGDAVDIAIGGDNQSVSATDGAITIRYGDEPVAQPPAPPVVTPQPPTTPTGGGSTRRPSTGGGGGGGRTGGSGGGSSGGSGASSGAGSTGPFVPSATQRVPVAVSLALPVDTFAAPTPVEVLVNAPGECGTDVATFDGLAAQVGIVYAFDAAAGATADATSGATAGATAELIAAGARQLAQFAERGTQQRPCELRVTLLSAPSGCTLRADQPAADQPAADTPADTPADATASDVPAADAPAAPSSTDDVRTDDAGRSYVELAWSEDTASLALTPTLSCSSAT